MGGFEQDGEVKMGKISLLGVGLMMAVLSNVFATSLYGGDCRTSEVVCPKCGSRKVKKLTLGELCPCLASIMAPFTFSGMCLCEECGLKFSLRSKV